MQNSEPKNKHSCENASVDNSGIRDDGILSEDCLEMKDVEIKGEGQKLSWRQGKESLIQLLKMLLTFLFQSWWNGLESPSLMKLQPHGNSSYF